MMFVTKQLPLSIPASLNIPSSITPAAPTNGLHTSTSFAPAASPTITIRASMGPSPFTILVTMSHLPPSTRLLILLPRVDVDGSGCGHRYMQPVWHRDRPLHPI